MKYSKLFGKTVKIAPRSATMTSHKLLYQGGFIRESVAGRYFMLPLGMRVQDKVTRIIEEEMDSGGAQKMITPVLHPLALWQETNRTNTTGFELIKVTDRRGDEFVLGGTGEEMFTDVVRNYHLSYKDLPINVYQFSSKFRDEIRVRGGLLRVREFLMKDAYSFHTDEEDFLKEYEKIGQTYERIFKRMGLVAISVLADNGYIGGEYCHEYVVDSEIGESKYLFNADRSYIAHEDVAEFTREDINLDEEMKEFEIIEQPEWVKTMEDNEKHYGLPKARFLKNVVYRHRITGEIIIATIRGDLEVNKNKLEHVLDAVGQLEDATDEDLAKIGTKSGYVHCWGHEGARYIGDISLTTVRNFIGGQKEETTDSINVNYGRDFECEILADIALAKAGYLDKDGKSALEENRGIEVGNIFQLGYHYSSKMSAYYIDSTGANKEYYMGCYGIGVGRTIASIVELHNDDKGIIWPITVSPYHVHLVELGQDEEISQAAEKLYTALWDAGVEVLWDDRKDVSAGVILNDADLIGIPIRLLISSRSMEQGSVELKYRESGDTIMIEYDTAVDLIKQKIKDLEYQVFESA